MTSSDDTDEPPTRSSDSDVFSSPLESALAEDTSSPSPQSRPTNAVTIAQDFTTRALDFLSHANNETLGACLVGLAAVTYLVLGRIGLLLIGVILGIVLQAAWDGSSRGGDEGGAEERVKEIRRRRETGLDVVTRALDWRDERGSMMTDEEGSGDGEDKMALRGALNFSGFAKETAEALDSFTDAIIRDYVRWWYTPILPTENLFPHASRQTLVAFFLSISNHLSRKRPADTFLDFVTNSSSIIIVFLNELSTALSASSGATPSEAVHSYLDTNPESSLANVLDPRQQQKKLNIVAEDILRRFLDKAAYMCEPARVFLREVLSGLVLEMTVQSCSRPEWINEWIIYLLEGEEPELLNAIDAGMSGETKGTTKVEKGANGVSAESEKAEAGKQHQRRVSKAELAMKEAMLEAQRLNRMIAEEEAGKDHQGQSSKTDSREGTGVGLDSRADDVSVNTPSLDSSRMAPSEMDSSLATSVQSQDSNFTSFDQLLPGKTSITPSNLINGTSATPESPSSAHIRSPSASQVPPLTLHKATVSIFDDSTPTEKGKIRTKPLVDYLLQIEPSSSHYPGWMIARKYSDFETLHEVLRRISVISGVVGFTEQHPDLPSWKGQTKSGLRELLEKYLHTALQYRQLAESEGMKRFLEKDQGNGKTSPGVNKAGFPGIGWPNPAAFETMGKGMLDVLASAPKGAAGGGKALLGGVSGVLGGVGSLGKKATDGAIGGLSRSTTNSSLTMDRPNNSRLSIQSLNSSPDQPRDSHDGSTTTTGRTSQDTEAIIRNLDTGGSQTSSPRPSLNGSMNGGLTRTTSMKSGHSPILEDREELHLPPPPSDMPDDYGPASILPSALHSFLDSSSNLTSSHHSDRPLSSSVSRSSLSTSDKAPVSFAEKPVPSSTVTNPPSSTATTLSPSSTTKPPPSTSTKPPPPPLTEQETQIAIELLFAIITELYTLSSAWNIRRTLLTAAKTFLLRPGNPNLEAIRLLIQDSLIGTHTSPAGLAALIKKVEMNALPTEEELKRWPKPPTKEEKAMRRVKARKLLIEKGMPRALSGVMGAAASGEALGRVFDVLQEERVARGLVFGLVLQGVRAVVQ